MNPQDQGQQDNSPPPVTLSNLRKAIVYLEMFRGEMDREEIADGLDMTTSGLRKLIAPIEFHLGHVSLAERDETAPHKLAPVAEEFLAAAKKLIDDYDALFSPKKFGVRRVRVGAYQSVISFFFSRYVFPDLLMPGRDGPRADSPEPFSARFPLYQLEVIDVGDRPNVIREVERGALDFGVVDFDATRPEEVVGFERLPLFESAPRGFVYHKHNADFAGLASVSARFPLDGIRTQNIILNEHDLEAVTDSRLPDPIAGKATRCLVSSYGQVYAAVAQNLGIGIGFIPKGSDPEGDVRLLPFSEIRCRSPQHLKTVRLLAKRGISSFNVYIPEGWDRPRAKGGLTDAAKFVLAAVRASAAGYTHDYIS